MIRAAGYARQSLDVAEGIDRQKPRIRALIDARGWTFTGVYEDNDTSASKARGKGTAWATMLDDLRAGRVDAIVAVDLDRLLRTTRDLNTLIDLGAKVVTVDGEIDLSTADGEFRATMLAGIARFESRRKGERQKRANDHRAKLGKPQHSGRAFGYDLDGTIRPTEADVVREVFHQFTRGDGLHTITAWLAATGVTNTRGKAWTRSGVHDLLLNPRYVAERWILRTQPDGKRVREYVGPGTWEPIITEDAFRAVGAVLTDPARRDKAAAEGNARKYLGAGTYLCAVCDAPLKTAYGVLSAKDGAKTTYRKYECPRFHVSRRADYTDEVVEGAISARLRDPAITSALASEDNAGAVRELRDEANGLRDRIDGFAIDFADGLLNARQVQIATERAETRLHELDMQLAQIGSTNALSGILGAPDPAAAWLALPDPRARAVVLDALCTVRIHRQPRGRRPSDANPDKVAAWAEGFAAGIELVWNE
ncbi:recombinase family protein [Microbacterium panaciterrae]|uniref:Recombinase family protein n=1 Tax=Microbacterium panaciterrae TaxID=985759 RepID=A0ABP8P9F4_9MICO